MVPVLFLNNRNGFIGFRDNVDNQERKLPFKIELNHWYNIIIENRKVVKLEIKS